MCRANIIITRNLWKQRQFNILLMTRTLQPSSNRSLEGNAMTLQWSNVLGRILTSEPAPRRAGLLNRCWIGPKSLFPASVWQLGIIRWEILKNERTMSSVSTCLPSFSKTSVEFSVHCTKQTSIGIPCPSIVTKSSSAEHSEAPSRFAAAQVLRQRPLNRVLRANPFTIITNLLRYSVGQTMQTMVP